MKKNNYVFVLIILLFSNNSLFSSVNSIRVKIITDRAYVYIEADENSNIIDIVSKGMILNLLGSRKNKSEWYYISYFSEKRGSNLSGFIKSSAAKIVFDEKESKEELIVKNKEKKKEQKVYEQDENQKNLEELEKEKQKKEETMREELSRETKKNGFKAGIGFYGGYTIPVTYDNSEGISYGGSINLLISQNFAIELSGLNFKSDVTENPDALSSGELTITTFNLSLQIRLPMSDLLAAYIVGGGSYFLNNFSLNNSIVNSWDNLGFTVKEEVESGYGFNVGAGLDVSVNRNFIIGIEGRYFDNKQEGSWEISDQLSNEIITTALGIIDMSYTYVGIRITILF